MIAATVWGMGPPCLRSAATARGTLIVDHATWAGLVSPIAIGAAFTPTGTIATATFWFNPSGSERLVQLQRCRPSFAVAAATDGPGAGRFTDGEIAEGGA